MRKSNIIGLCLAAAPLVAHAQLSEISEFPGEFTENFEDKMRDGDCISPRVFGGTTDLCSGAPLISSGWSFRCVISPFEGSRFMGSASGAAEYTFSEPIARFGGYFGTNALEPGQPTDEGRVEFYDEFGALIGEGILRLDDTCGWNWNGWESDVAVFSIIVRGSVFGGAFVDMDDMRIDLFDSGGCYADCDGSGTLDFFDFLCYQNAFAAGEPYADCDGSGALDFFDFLCYQNEFAAGCP